jgi:ribosome-associated protein
MLVPENEVSFEASRSSGPGGQHVQKTSTKITLRWNVWASKAFEHEEKARITQKFSNRINKSGEFILHVETHRSQHRNKQLAYKLLNNLIKMALKENKPRIETRPSKKSIQRRLRKKNIISQKKQQRGWNIDTNS